MNKFFFCCEYRLDKFKGCENYRVQPRQGSFESGLEGKLKGKKDNLNMFKCNDVK